MPPTTATGEARPRKQRIEVELQLLTEWLSKTDLGGPWQTNVRVGAIKPDLPDAGLSAEELALLGNHRRRVDALVYARTKTILIEAAMRPDLGEISRLAIYCDLVPQTPELSKRSHLPVECHLLVAIEDPIVTAAARKAGIVVHVFAPAWVGAYLDEVAARARRAPRT